MVNCAAVALFASTLKCRCLPVAVSVLYSPSQNNILVDPTLAELKSYCKYETKLRLVFNVDTEELLYSSMEATRGLSDTNKPLSLDNLEQLIGVGLSSAKRIQQWIL